MLDELNKRPSGEGQAERAPRLEVESPAVVDREVPLVTGPAYAAMHRWLDGEATAAEAARGDAARYVELWRRVGAETERHRRAKAPAGLTDRIMAALPDAVPQRSELRITPTATPLAAAAASAATTATASAPVSLVTPTESSWWQRPVEMNPGVALVAAAGLLALGAVLGSALRGQ